MSAPRWKYPRWNWCGFPCPRGRSCGRDSFLLATIALSLAWLAIYPAFPAAPTLEAGRSHWAFQPVRRPTLPPASGSVHPIDHFILAKLRPAGLSLAPAASRETLIRRVTLDLVGLPPTPAEIDAFVNDRSPRAYEQLLERLLASPHYGERWGRHWLDLARYAETDGFEHDAVRPHSWRYRDYVIRSFNADQPYDQFIREQLAGDELAPGGIDAQIATGFNLLGPDMVDSADQVQRRLNTLNDMTDTAALAFMGLTIGCARCHDHKFEPLSQRDYFALQAFFAPAVFRRDTPIPTPGERATHEVALKEYQAHPVVQELAALEAPHREKLRAQKLGRLSSEAREAHGIPAEARTTEQANLVLETLAQLDISEKELTAAVTGADSARRQALLETARKISKPAPLPLTMSLANSNNVPPRARLLVRGDYNQPREEIAAAIPAVLPVSLPSPTANARSALAAWLTDPANPLTARVMVNRVWLHHFGRGLVATPSDFGAHGQPPTHPELLDWLASEFIASRWSLKTLHKLVLFSRTYQQTSAAFAPADPENRLYSRFPRLRLEGEVIRDSLLAISGELNPKMYGPGVFPPIPADVFKGAKGWATSSDPRDHARRSIYIFARRNLRFPFLEVFDAPDSNLSCPQRGRSTTAPQSLTLLNAGEVMAAATATAVRVQRDARTADEQAVLAYRLILGRKPTADEQSLARGFLARSPLSEFCRVLFNLNEFVYVD